MIMFDIFMKTLTVSIVIPVYNEELHLESCLQSIADQTVSPFEVIVVDNNSTDASVEIARRFPFVTLLSESRQGLIATRNTGFAAASGDILARINADAELSSDWVARLQHDFRIWPQAAAVAGVGEVPISDTNTDRRSKIGSLVYLLDCEAYFGVPIMWGANMAMRRSAWEKIKDDAQLDDSLVHEDQDLSLCLAARGLEVRRDSRLLMTTSEISYHYLPKLAEYMRRRWATRRLHEQLGSFDRLTFRGLQPWQCHWRRFATAIPMAIFYISCPLSYPAARRRERLASERV
ncbi:MAG: glycosyltransferase family 2 protein [Candidatus Saccharibacteria bacterium]|nr:glycosyltransferase family 2 protein [Candidatus Saccharibacteria bacterium]